jgi:hypothetical protein
MLQQVTTTAGASRAHWFVVVAALTLIPFHLVAQSPAPSVDSAIVANVAVVQPIGAAPALPSIELNRRPERKAAQAQAPRPAVPAALPQKSAAPKPSAVEEQNATSASANEQFAKDLAEELNKNAAAISAQAQEAVHQLLAQRDELARRYSPMHPDLRALDLQLAELRQLSSNEALKGLSAGMAGLSGLQEQLRFAAQALQNAPGGQDPAAAAAREAQIKALSQQIEALSKQLAAMQPNAGDQKDVQQKVQLKALAAQLKALEAVQREVERDRLRQSTRQFLDAEVAQRRANVEALTAARQSAVNEQDRQRLDVQLQAARAELQALEAKTRDAARAAQVTRQAEVRQRATNQQLDSRQLEAAIARERANVERQKQLLNSAQQRLSQAEARLREREQRLKQQNSQTPQAPQAPQPPQKSQTPQNPRP